MAEAISYNEVISNMRVITTSFDRIVPTIFSKMSLEATIKIKSVMIFVKSSTIK